MPFGLEVVDGQLVFRRPDDRLIERSPLHPTATDDLEQLNAELGLEIDSKTAVPHLYAGDTLDYDLAVDSLWWRDYGQFEPPEH